jgi:hypothetical protein
MFPRTHLGLARTIQDERERAARAQVRVGGETFELPRAPRRTVTVVGAVRVARRLAASLRRSGAPWPAGGRAQSTARRPCAPGQARHLSA